jgi:hypothetical protein
MPAFGHQHNKLKQRFHNLKGENRMKKTTTVLSGLGIAIGTNFYSIYNRRATK